MIFCLSMIPCYVRIYPTPIHFSPVFSFSIVYYIISVLHLITCALDDLIIFKFEA
jgi:hypothetical protein